MTAAEENRLSELGSEEPEICLTERGQLRLLRERRWSHRVTGRYMLRSPPTRLNRCGASLSSDAYVRTQDIL